MEKHTFEEIKELLLKSINEDDCESELTIRFIDRDSAYMIIIYDDYCSFQRCDGGLTGEKKYQTLDEMYKAQQIDNIILERDWDKIIKFDSMDFEALRYWR